MTARMRYLLYVFTACILLVILLSAILAVVYWQSRPADDRPAGNYSGNNMTAMIGGNATVKEPVNDRPVGNHTGLNNTTFGDTAIGMTFSGDQSLGNYTGIFRRDTVVVIGEKATRPELDGAREIRDSLGNLTGAPPAIKTVTELGPSGKTGSNLILVGTPETNSLVGEIYDINNKDIRAGYFNEYRDSPRDASYGSIGILLLFPSPWARLPDPSRYVLVADGWDDNGLRSAAYVLSNDDLVGFNGAGIFTRWNGTYTWYSTNEVTDATVGSIASVYLEGGMQTYPEAHFKIINVTSRNSDWAVVIGTFDSSERYVNGTSKERLMGTNTVIVTRNGEAREAA